MTASTSAYVAPSYSETAKANAEVAVHIHSHFTVNVNSTTTATFLPYLQILFELVPSLKSNRIP